MSDPCIYTFRNGNIFAMIELYVADIPIVYNDTPEMQAFKAKLGARLKTKYFYDQSQLLGTHITRDMTARTISMDQSKNVKDILVKHNMYDCKSSSLPMEPGFLSGIAQMNSSLLTGVAKDVYTSMLGNLQHAAMRTRPDVSTTLSILGYAQANPTEAHLSALKKVVRYLKGTIKMRMTLGGGGDHNLQFTSFADADLANENRRRKLQSGYLFTLGRGHVNY
jgi:hypothetical protein